MQNNSALPVPRKRKLVDAFTRSLHALMAFSFTVAYITSDADTFRLVHVTMGYTLGGMFLLRVLWGILGPRRVSLWALAGKLSGARQAMSLIQNRDGLALLKLVLAFSMVTLLLFTLPVIASGYITYFEFFGEWTKEIHETVANLMLVAVIGHVAAVGLVFWVFPRGQVRPMLCGQVNGNGPDLVKHNLRPLALALTLGVTGFWSWQAYQYKVDPGFKQQPAWLHPEGAQNCTKTTDPACCLHCHS